MRSDAVPATPDLASLRPLVERHATPERVRRYLRALSDVPAPSGAASALRAPVLKRLLRDDGLLEHPRLHLHEDFERTGNLVMLTGAPDPAKPLWYFTHLDTLSYLVQPRENGRYPLVPFGYHLIREGTRNALAYRFRLDENRYEVVARGRLGNHDGAPVFVPDDDPGLRPGDRIVLTAPYREDPDSGEITAHLDNAGAAAALAVAAGVLARAGIDALLAFPDEEEGPESSGNQAMGRGGTRLVNLLPPPELAFVGDVQQAGGGPRADTRGGPESATRLGGGAVLSEFSSLARGAVTPPHLYALADAHADALQRSAGVRVQRSNNAYTSRSDDVSLLLRTPNLLLLGFAGFDRHFDHGEPRAHLGDLVDLARAFVYFALLRPRYRRLLAALGSR